MKANMKRREKFDWWMKSWELKAASLPKTTSLKWLHESWLRLYAGFREVNVHTMDETQDPKIDLGCMINRLLAVARRP